MFKNRVFVKFAVWFAALWASANPEKSRIAVTPVAAGGTRSMSRSRTFGCEMLSNNWIWCSVVSSMAKSTGTNSVELVTLEVVTDPTVVAGGITTPLVRAKFWIWTVNAFGSVSDQLVI